MPQLQLQRKAAAQENQQSDGDPDIPGSERDVNSLPRCWQDNRA